MVSKILHFVFIFWALLFEFTLEIQKSPIFSNFISCQVVKILQTKTPLEVISFVKNILEKILLWIPILLGKNSTKKEKSVKELLIFLQLPII
jgi:hypothetical protein